MRFYITAIYYHEIEGDAGKSLQTLKSWAALYPNNQIAQTQLVLEYQNLGQVEKGISPATRAVGLEPLDIASSFNLGSIQTQSGQLAAARQSCESAIAMGMDGDDMRGLLVTIMFAQHDEAGIATQIAWAHAHDDSFTTLADEVSIALARGRFGMRKR